MFRRLSPLQSLLFETLRIDMWWENKLCPVLAAMYATALLLDLPLASIWGTLLVAIAAIAVEAIYATVLNDLTDRLADQRAGKLNRLAGKSTLSVAVMLAAPVAAGLMFAFAWRSDSLVVPLYAAGWVCFLLYSLPPARLKERGFAGVLADALGAHVLTTLVAAVLVFRAAGRDLDVSWLVTLGMWALACGLRNAISHQMNDRANDLRIGLRSFAVRYRTEQVVWLGTFVVFPVELIALGLALWRVGHPLPIVAMAAYSLLSYLRYKLWGLGVVIVEPKPRSYMALHSYYEAFLPVSLLMISVLRHPADALVLVAHVALFRRPIAEAVLNTWTIAKMPLRRVLRSWV